LLEEGYLVGTASDPHVLRLAPPAVMPTWACRQLVVTLDEILTGAASAVA
jgi:acetylornithine/succinyldiaminopimelate/putrescine aminotransferase